MHNHTQIIAEVKTRSPFGFVSDRSFEELFAVANEVGDMLSIHTDPRWGGSFEVLERARALTSKPILAKGIHASDADIERALTIGANFVLVVGRIPDMHAEKCLIEPLTLKELAAIPPHLRAVWNSRDLKDGSFKKETFIEARNLFSGWLCQASNVRTVEDIEEGADAVLVGTNILDFAKSLTAQE